ncbi:MAG TPA: hypothetical protein VFN88_09885 [Caulobacteraceae bacterium]|nr:hypothetical protein [Caulobacteraceae bacterium]
MIKRRTVLALTAASVTAAAFGVAHAALKSPEDVKTALRLMMQVTNDFDRQISRKTYPRLPHENEEFKEATDALTKAIAGEPSAFKTKVGGEIAKARGLAQKIADESGGGVEATLRADHGEMLKAVNVVFAAFPAELRPDPNVQPGRPAPKG